MRTKGSVQIIHLFSILSIILLQKTKTHAFVSPSFPCHYYPPATKSLSSVSAAITTRNTARLTSTGTTLTARVAAHAHPTTLAGRFAAWSKWWTFENMELFVHGAFSIVHWRDVVLLAIVGWGMVPWLNWIIGVRNKEDPVLERVIKKKLPYNLATAVAQMAQIATSVYGVDMITVGLKHVGVPNLPSLPALYAKCVYTLWATNRLCAIKRWAIAKALNVKGNLYGRAKVFDRILDVVLRGLSYFLVLDVLKVQLGVAASGILAFGSATTLVVSLAFQDLAKQLLNGLMLASSNRFYEGDVVSFGNGVVGVVTRQGWMETLVRAGDEASVSVPNSDLAKSKVSNLSRVYYCQVRQVLRFHYQDVDKLPNLVKDMKEEIQKSCPKLITDGSRPFRVHWTDYHRDYLEVTVNSYFTIKPIGDEYWDNRMEVLMAIHRATEKNQMQFAKPVTSLLRELSEET